MLKSTARQALGTCLLMRVIELEDAPTEGLPCRRSVGTQDCVVPETTLKNLALQGFVPAAHEGILRVDVNRTAYFLAATYNSSAFFQFTTFHHAAT
jgi:hypothetical protein